MIQSIDAEGGRLVAENRGEFGGNVWWEPQSGAPRQQVAGTNLVAFVRTKAGLLGLTGLSHMGSNRGAVVRFQRRPGQSWEMQTVLELGAAPYAVSLLDDGTLLIVVSGGVVSVQMPDRVTVLHRNPVWNSTYPNSIVRDATGRIYVGMRSTVARLSPDRSGFVEDWLVPASCQRRVPEPSPIPICRCVAP